MSALLAASLRISSCAADAGCAAGVGVAVFTIVVRARHLYNQNL
jgi:hypothetical protein